MGSKEFQGKDREGGTPKVRDVVDQADQADGVSCRVFITMSPNTRDESCFGNAIYKERLLFGRFPNEGQGRS
jgi:hypothetical protein